MGRPFGLGALVGLFCFPIRIEAQYWLIELAEAQLAKSVSATIQDATGAPVQESAVWKFSVDWKRVLRSSSTDKHGPQGSSDSAPLIGSLGTFLRLDRMGDGMRRDRMAATSPPGSLFRVTTHGVVYKAWISWAIPAESHPMASRMLGSEEFRRRHPRKAAGSSRGFECARVRVWLSQ
jgi:hypothetical protein